MSQLTWKEFARQTVEAYCNEQGVRTFTIDQFMDAALVKFAEMWPNNQNVRPKIRQQLQRLRDDGVLTFVDFRGTYTLRTAPLLKDEVEPEQVEFLRSLPPQKREYLVEVFARNQGWVRLARQFYGDYCLFPDCHNTFITPRGIPYVEVHHIRALCDGGEDGLWNLSVVCAHHHRMAHFAEERVRADVAGTLRSIVEQRYSDLAMGRT